MYPIQIITILNYSKNSTTFVEAFINQIITVKNRKLKTQKFETFEISCSN